MPDFSDPKAALHHYLRMAREGLLWKLEGLSEREVRTPRTSTGNSLLGLVKHCLNWEAAYFGPPFGRYFPTPHELVPTEAYTADPHADFYAREDESVDTLVDLYRRVAAFADQTIEQLPLDAVGRVAWWGSDGQDVTLQQVMIHVTFDLARHAGHADIMREQLDGVAGMQRDATNLPPDMDWPAYVAKLTRLADRFD